MPLHPPALPHHHTNLNAGVHPQSQQMMPHTTSPPNRQQSVTPLAPSHYVPQPMQHTHPGMHPQHAMPQQQVCNPSMPLAAQAQQASTEQPMQQQLQEDLNDLELILSGTQ